MTHKGNPAAGPVRILLLACIAGLLFGQAMSQNSPCPVSCDTNKLQPVNNTGSSSTDIMTAVKVTLDSILGAIGDVAGPEGAEVAQGAQELMDTGFSLWTAWNSVANPQESIKNSLHNDMVKLQDYLVCEMQNIVSQAETDIINDMTQTQLNTFNAFIDNTITTLTNECGALNCLNTSNLAPSQRNAAVNNNCVVPYPSQDCQSVNAWNPMAPVPCTYVDPGSGDVTHGVCDADHRCYSSDISRQGARDFFTAVSAKFNGGNINNLYGLNQFGPGDMPSLVLGAKMTLLQINLYQQLIMLGSANGEMSTMKAFATEAADWLQARYSYLTDIDRIRAQVGNYSTIKPGVQAQVGIANPNLGGSVKLISESPDGNTATVSCASRGDGEYGVSPPCFLWVAQYGSYQLAWGCNAAQAQPLYQQTESFCYWKQHGQGLPAQSAPCSVDTLPYGLADVNNHNFVSVCTNFNAFGAGTCTLDNTFPGKWMDTHNQQLQAGFTQAKEQLAQQLLANLTTTLADVSGTIKNLRQLAQVGMPSASLNIFATSYPLQQCNPPVAANNNAAASVAFVPGVNQLLKGDGAVPLPAGAVVANASSAAAPANVGGRKLKL